MFDENEAVKNPDCGIRVKPETAAAQAGHGGRAFPFCSPRGADVFALDPGESARAASTTWIRRRKGREPR